MSSHPMARLYKPLQNISQKDTKILLLYTISLVAMAQRSSAEYRAFVNQTEQMVTAISTDLTTVTIKLFTRDMIPSLSRNQFQTTEEEACQIVWKIIKQIKTSPEKFEMFIAVLNEIPPLQDLAKLIGEEREKIKMEDQETALVCFFFPRHFDIVGPQDVANTAVTSYC